VRASRELGAAARVPVALLPGRGAAARARLVAAQLLKVAHWVARRERAAALLLVAAQLLKVARVPAAAQLFLRAALRLVAETHSAEVPCHWALGPPRTPEVPGAVPLGPLPCRTRRPRAEA
jgi:hypothetical protein